MKYERSFVVMVVISLVCSAAIAACSDDEDDSGGSRHEVTDSSTPPEDARPSEATPDPLDDEPAPQPVVCAPIDQQTTLAEPCRACMAQRCCAAATACAERAGCQHVVDCINNCVRGAVPGGALDPGEAPLTDAGADAADHDDAGDATEPDDAGDDPTSIASCIEQCVDPFESELEAYADLSDCQAVACAEECSVE